jgi:hypothetical protein
MEETAARVRSETSPTDDVVTCYYWEVGGETRRAKASGSTSTWRSTPVCLLHHSATPNDDGYFRAADCRLVIDVADISHKLDAYNAAMYALGGVAECWIVDLHQRAVVVHQHSNAGDYAEVSTAALCTELAIPEGCGSIVPAHAVESADSSALT